MCLDFFRDYGEQEDGILRKLEKVTSVQWNKFFIFISSDMGESGYTRDRYMRAGYGSVCRID